MRNWLLDQYVILTGASGGIGRELTKRLIVKYGARVFGIGRSEEKMQTLLSELGDKADRFSYELFDVGDPAAWQDFRKKLDERAIRPVLLVNNAGYFPPLARAESNSSFLVEKTLQNNFLSAVYAIEALSPILSDSGTYKPAIVNICSSAALCAVVGSSAYTASKSAMKGYTEALQLEQKGKKHIGIIYPGTTATDLFRGDENVKNSAMGKIATPAPKMAKKVARKIYRRKKRAILGWDAKAMYFLAKLMPVKGPALIYRAMKLSKSKAFDNVFDYDKSGKNK